jgi:kynureninase
MERSQPGQRPGLSGAESADLARLRDEFPILATTVYLISNSLGAMPRDVEASLAEYVQTWATRGVRAWAERWWEMSREVASALEPLIGASAGSVSMHESVTAAHMVVLSTLPPPGLRDTIVCSAADFPSMIYLYRAQTALGYRLRIVPANNDFTSDVERIADAIDDRTALVAVSHVLFRSSYILDPAPIVARAHAVGAPVVLDVYQSAGIVPLDVSALGVDYAAGGCLKWLCGGPGNAFLYTRPDLLGRVRPRFTGWFSHPQPFAFSTDDYTPPADARRMSTGTPAIPAYYAALPGLRLIATAGIDRIRRASTDLTGYLLGLVDRQGFSTVATRQPDRLGGTVAIRVPEGPAVARTLNARDFVVDYRPGVGIRISPHFYNTRDELEAVMAEIARIVEARDYVEMTPSIVT